MNWGECKLTTLQKIDPSITNLTVSRYTKDYLNSMVGVANRGLQDLATAGKYISKRYTIFQPKVETVFATPLSEIYQKRETHEIICQGGSMSFYFEVAGELYIEVYSDYGREQLIHNTSKGFTAHKGMTVVGGTLKIKFVENGNSPYSFRNVAIYPCVFDNVADIWDYVPAKRYDLRALADDFYKLETTDVIREGYGKTSDYYWEGDSTLVLPGLEGGEWIVHYFAYPQGVTKDTTDETELALDPEVAALLPVYMASQLMEDEDSSMAYYFFQQYEEAKNRLNATRNAGKVHFIDRNGW